MATVNLSLDANIHILELTNDEGENMFTTSVMQEYLAAFDTVEKYPGNSALLITSKHEKTFSTGINLNWLTAQSEADQKQFLLAFETVLYRLAMLNAPTVVCLNGNAYAGGALIAAAADFRVMRADLGRYCLPEININMSFPPIMVDVIDRLPNKQAVKHMMLTGKAYTGQECLVADIVDAIFSVDELQPQAFAMAKALGEKNREVYTTIRNSMLPNIARHKATLELA